MSLNKSLKMSYLITFVALVVGCNPTKFQTNTSATRAQKSVLVVIPTPEVLSEPEIIVPAKIENTCELQGKTKVLIGEEVSFTVKTNFEVPTTALTLMSGKSFDIEFTSDAATSAMLISRGLAYTSTAQAGIHKRQIHIIDATGKTLCSSPVLNIEFVGFVLSDQSCISVHGKISDTNHDNCLIESWTLYREMSARNLVRLPIPSSNGSLNMTNPAAKYCQSISANGYDLTTGICTVNKNTLLSILNN